MKNKPSLFQQVLRFGIVGGLSFIIDFIVYSVILLIFGKARVTVMIAAFLGFTISLIFNYLSSMRFVFVHDENMDRRKEFTVFALLSLIGLLLNEVLIMGVLFVFDHVKFLQSGILWDFKEWIGKIFATGVVMVYNFVTRKIFIEKKS